MVVLGKLERRRLNLAVCLMALLCVSSNCGATELPASHSPATNANAGNKDEVLYHLDLRNPTISQTIERGTHEVEQAKFVRIEVPEVENPKKYALKFEVQYQPDSGEKVHLGTFSLFPADNPGSFIVPTKGLVKAAGHIVLTLTTPDKVAPDTLIQVGVRKMKFVKE